MGLALGLCGKPLPIGGGEPVIPDDESGNYLTFASAEPFTIGVNNATKNWDGTLEYSTDTTNWNEWDGAAAIASAEHGGEHRIYMRGSGNTVITGSADVTVSIRWVLTGDGIRCVGDIENLLDYETVANGKHPVMADYCYTRMFLNCSSLTAAPKLSATELAYYCYHSMFSGCTSLTTPPALPATELADYCYAGVFQNCTGLVALPELPATELKNCSYISMFNGCSSIKLSETQTDEYTTEYRIPPKGTATSAIFGATNYMFDYTGGTFTGTPSINTTYYTSNGVV